jgi:hypothetical protein
LALGKEAFAECFFFALVKETSLPRAVYRTLGKAVFAECRGFAECFLFGPPALLLLAVPLLLLQHYYTSQRSSHRRGSSCCNDGDKFANKVQLPPSPPGLPIIGHLHLVADLPHVSLRNLSANHGFNDVMFLRLGSVPTLILSSPRAAEAIMRTHDHVFASRPASTVSDDLLYGSSDIAFSPYGEHWRQIRKLVTMHLFTVKKVHS